MTTLEHIATLYIQYHKLRNEIAFLKYSRTLDFKSCNIDKQNSCYKIHKINKNHPMCESCQSNWNAHLQIVRLGKKAGGIKYSLNRLIENIVTKNDNRH